MASIAVHDRYTGEKIAEYPFISGAELEKVLARAVQAFETSSRRAPAHQRAAVLRDAETRLASRREEFEAAIVAEAGKPLSLARVEVDRALGVLRFAAGEAERFGGELLRLDAAAPGRDGFGLHLREPRGVVLGITPFNFPLNLVLHKVAPAIACGCPIVVKPSPHTPGVALKVLSLFDAAPEGWVQVALASDADTAKLATDPRVAMVSFTGSVPVGWKIREQVPRKPVTLELGGNAWAIVAGDLSDARLAIAARKIAAAAYGYAGQSCISVQNVAVDQGVWDRFMPLLREETRRTPYGDPRQPETVCGPVIGVPAAQRIAGILKSAKALRVTASERPVGSPERSGPATVLAPQLLEFKEGEPVEAACAEEIFGPVAAARPYSDFDAVIGWVNGSAYGLQAGLFSENWPLIHRAARELRVGGLVVGDTPSLRFDHQPYGGVRQSGTGREGLRYAMDEMTEARFVALTAD